MQRSIMIGFMIIKYARVIQKHMALELQFLYILVYVHVHVVYVCLCTSNNLQCYDESKFMFNS